MKLFILFSITWAVASAMAIDNSTLFNIFPNLSNLTQNIGLNNSNSSFMVFEKSESLLSPNGTELLSNTVLISINNYSAINSTSGVVKNATKRMVQDSNDFEVETTPVGNQSSDNKTDPSVGELAKQVGDELSRGLLFRHGFIMERLMFEEPKLGFGSKKRDTDSQTSAVPEHEDPKNKMSNTFIPFPRFIFI